MKRIADYFLRRKGSANIAKDRLQIIIAQERTEATNRPDYLPLLRQEILAVVAKYIHVDMSQVSVDFHRKDNNSVLELNVLLPENPQEVRQAATQEA
ncbi:MAG: cell division topological specificity factor MinE [Gammaproteobacteria bacterium RIFCSPHIGHO2_12_FULL_45_9]|nr:MAG: cell division topological specificity factor MinE [Gammaproteobacteria bacterium RIFCSPHIGHO2_12_FULL_45_9]